MASAAEPATRQNVRFDSAGSSTVPGGSTRLPGGGPAPCIVLAHGFGALKEGRLDAYAERFAAAGYAALVFDYRHFGESEGEPRQLLDVRRQHEDWHAAVAFARGADGVDPERVALWGSSFSGGHVIHVAATTVALRRSSPRSRTPTASPRCGSWTRNGRSVSHGWPSRTAPPR